MLSDSSRILYRDGEDSLAWHADRIPEEIEGPIVALVSPGEPRKFPLRPKGGGGSTTFVPAPGHLLVPGGGSQRDWEHSVPKVAQAGPRISVRFFGAWQWPRNILDSHDWVAQAYRGGVPMGGSLHGGETAPEFLVWAVKDPVSAWLQRLQIVKGWIGTDGAARETVYDVAGDRETNAWVDEETCEPKGPGFAELCEVWTDPDFDPARKAFYYARVLENPSCRWSTLACNALPEGQRPAVCSDPAVPELVRERAWSSPIWYAPEAS